MFCGFCWYVWVWCFSCLWELVVYQTSQPSKQDLESSDNDFGIDSLFECLHFLTNKQVAFIKICKWLTHGLNWGCQFGFLVRRPMCTVLYVCTNSFNLRYICTHTHTNTKSLTLKCLFCSVYIWWHDLPKKNIWHSL